MDLTTAMLADAAHVAEGKLYILGGQWDRITVASLPAVHPSMAVVIVIRIEYSEAPKTFNVLIDLMLDGDSTGVRAGGQVSIGHAPGLAHGAPQFAPVAVTFPNVSFDRAGRYEYVVSVEGKVLGQIPLEVVQGMVLSIPGDAKPPDQPTA